MSLNQSASNSSSVSTRSCNECPSPTDSDCLLLDVRTPTEFESAHVPGSHLLPLDQLDADRIRKLAGDRPIHLLCRSGSRASQAASKLAAAGLNNLIVVEGGIQAWQAAGRPMHQSASQGMSIERQVRVAAGSLVLIGVLLGLVLHPGFYGLSAFVGAGLVFAGLTDWCGMGLLLARAPWNRRLGTHARQALVKA